MTPLSAMHRSGEYGSDIARLLPDCREATIELLADQNAVARVREAETAVAADQRNTVDEMVALMQQRRERA